MTAWSSWLRPGKSFESAGGPREVRAFLLRPLEPVVLHPGTWHWGPYPLDDNPVSLLNVQGLRYAEDNGRTDLAELGCRSRSPS